MDEYVKQKKVNASIQLENLENRDFSVIPEKEKKQTWFLLLAPIIAARRLRNEPQNSPLSHVLNQSTGPSIHTWKGVKRLIKFVLKMVDNAESIFSRTAEIKTDSNPDGIIRDMFAELRTVLYLDYKGFKNIRYIRRDNVDFSALFDNKCYYFETAYVRGPSFKTQQPACEQSSNQSPTVILGPKKLLNRFQSIYDKKEKQIIRHGYNEANSLIIIVTDLEEVFEPWLSRHKIQGDHPIENFIKKRKLSTVIFSPASVYEPELTALNGVFGKLNKFEWELFNSQIEKKYLLID